MVWSRLLRKEKNRGSWKCIGDWWHRYIREPLWKWWLRYKRWIRKKNRQFFFSLSYSYSSRDSSIKYSSATSGDIYVYFLFPFSCEWYYYLKCVYMLKRVGLIVGHTDLNRDRCLIAWHYCSTFHGLNFKNIIR